MRKLGRIALGFVILLTCSVVHAADPLKGRAEIQARNAGAGIVYIDGRSYQVTSRTRLVWSSGEPYTLASLQLPDEPGGPGLWPLLIAQYDAVEGRSGLVLNELILLRDAE